MPTYRRIARAAGTVLGICEGGHRMVAGPCRCGGCCPSGNQCLLRTNFDDINSQGQTDCPDFLAVTAQRPAGFPEGFTRLGRAFDVTVTKVATYTSARVRTCGNFGIDTPDPVPPAFNGTDQASESVAALDQVVRFRMLAYGQSPSVLGTGDWRVHAHLVDRVAQEFAQTWWYDPSALSCSRTTTSSDACGITGPTTDTVELAGEDAYRFLSIGAAFPLQVNDLAQVNPGPCDALAYHFTAWADVAGGVGPTSLRAALTPAEGFTTNDIRPVVRFDEDGFPETDECLGAAFRHQLARLGGSTSWKDVVGSSPPVTLPHSNAVSVEFNAGFDGSLDLTATVDLDSWSQAEGYSDGAPAGTRWYGPVHDRAEVTLTMRVTVVEACPGDGGPNFDCPDPASLFLAAVPCDPADQLPVIAYDPQNRPAGGQTYLWPPPPDPASRPYRPTSVPTLAPLVPGAWSEQSCAGGTRLGVACDGSGDTWPYDPAPVPAGTLTFLADDGKRYRVASTTTTLPPRAVLSYSQSPCPVGLYKARKCRNVGPTNPDPDEIAYEPVYGVGNGLVYLVTEYHAGPLDAVCVRVTYYRPTSEPATPGMVLATRVSNEPPCSRQDFDRCSEPGEPPIIIPGQGRAAEPRTPGTPRPPLDPAVALALGQQDKYYGCTGCGG